MNKTTFISIINTVLAAVLFIGTFTFFRACGMTEEGTWMTCHWAERTISLLAGTLVLLGLISIAKRSNDFLLAIYTACIINSFAIILVPGRLIDMCMMKTMRCWSVLSPASCVIAAAIIVLSVVGVYFVRKKR